MDEQELWQDLKKAQVVVEAKGFDFTDAQLLKVLDEYKESGFEENLQELIARANNERNSLSILVNEHFKLGLNL